MSSLAVLDYSHATPSAMQPVISDGVAFVAILCCFTYLLVVHFVKLAPTQIAARGQLIQGAVGGAGALEFIPQTPSNSNVTGGYYQSRINFVRGPGALGPDVIE